MVPFRIPTLRNGIQTTFRVHHPTTQDDQIELLIGGLILAGRQQQYREENPQHCSSSSPPWE